MPRPLPLSLLLNSHFVHIYSHLFSSILIYSHLFSSILISFHLFSSILIYSHLLASILIYSHLFSSILIYSHLFSSHLFSLLFFLFSSLPPLFSSLPSLHQISFILSKDSTEADAVRTPLLLDNICVDTASRLIPLLFTSTFSHRLSLYFFS